MDTNTLKDDSSKSILVENIKKAFETHKASANDIANELKKSLDEALGGPWHVVVGKSFATSVSHEKNGFAYVYIGNFAIICFKTA